MGHTSLVGLLDMSFGHIVSGSADGFLRIWDSDTLDFKHELATHNGASVCIQHDATRVIAGCNGSLILWDVRTGAYIRNLISGATSVQQSSLNDGLLVAASQRDGATVFDVFDFGLGDKTQ